MLPYFSPQYLDLGLARAASLVNMVANVGQALSLLIGRIDSQTVRAGTHRSHLLDRELNHVDPRTITAGAGLRRTAPVVWSAFG